MKVATAKPFAFGRGSVLSISNVLSVGIGLDVEMTLRYDYLVSHFGRLLLLYR